MKTLRALQINLLVLLMLLSSHAFGQQHRKGTFDSTATAVKEITVHNKKLIGYMRSDTFYLTTLQGKILLESDPGCAGWRFEDFNGDGYKDIVLEYHGRAPGDMAVYLYIEGTNSFVQVQNFDFPAAVGIGGTHYFYSYHHSGCADQDWDSDLFYLRDFQAVLIGNISGIGCPMDEREKPTIYVNRVRGEKKRLIKKYPIADNDYIKRTTKENRHLFPLLYGEPDKEHPYYWVAVGEDNGMSFVTHYGFYVYATSGVIKFCEPLTGRAINLERWRKSGRKR